MSDRIDIRSVKQNQLPELFLDEMSADMNFIFGDAECENPKKIPVHKLILASCSPVFKRMFYGSLPEHGDVRIADASIEGFKEFLQYFYLNDVQFSFENIGEVIYLADKYEMKDCLSICGTFLKQNLAVVNLGDALEMAMKYQMHELMADCKLTIECLHSQYFASESFAHCSTDILKMVLTSEELKFYSNDIFRGCIQWARHELEQQPNVTEPSLHDVRQKLGDYFKLIEFGAMESHEIISILAEYSEFFTTQDLVVIHKILKSKFPVVFSENRPFYRCDMRPHSKTSEQSGENHYIDKIESMIFESSKKTFLVGYTHGKIIPKNWFEPIQVWLTLARKASTAETSDIVLLRQRINCEDLFYVKDTRIDAIAIEPNTKYEISLKFNGMKAHNYHADSLYTSTVCPLEDEAKVTVEGLSIISNLCFRH